MTTIHAAAGSFRIVARIEDPPPLGWRFWMLAGFPGDPLDPSPYGGSRCLAPRWRGKLAGDRDLPCPDGCNWTACALAPAESPPGPPPAVVRLPAERPIAEKSSRCTLGDGFWMPAS